MSCLQLEDICFNTFLLFCIGGNPTWLQQGPDAPGRLVIEKGLFPPQRLPVQICSVFISSTSQ